jgi:anti-sigma-K factor RskA
MSDIEIHHLGAAYALDALDERERVAYEQHYSACEICRTDVREYRATAAELGALTVASPGADLKSRVMAEVASTRQLSPLPSAVVKLADRRPRYTRAMLSVAAVAVAFLAGAVLLGRGSNQFDDQLAEMMRAPDVQMVQLAGDQSGSFKVVWTSGMTAVIGDDLPDPGPGKRYELWMIDGAGSHAMRMLDTADGGDVERVIPIGGVASGWGITIESTEGSDVPTEPVLYLAEV